VLGYIIDAMEGSFTILLANISILPGFFIL
jgi:hypothetical protein